MGIIIGVSLASLGLLLLFIYILYRIFRKKTSLIKQVRPKQVHSIAINNNGAVQRQIVGNNANYTENHTHNHYLNQTSPGIACPNCHAETYRLYSNRGSRRIYECLNCHKTLTVSYDGQNITRIAMAGVILLEGVSLIHDYLQHHHLPDDTTADGLDLATDILGDLFS
jgi:hypothetical protein